MWEPIAESTVASNGGSRLGIWGGQSNKGSQKAVTCLNIPGSLTVVEHHTQRWIPFLGQQNSYFLLVELRDRSGQCGLTTGPQKHSGEVLKSEIC